MWKFCSTAGFEQHFSVVGSDCCANRTTAIGQKNTSFTIFANIVDRQWALLKTEFQKCLSWAKIHRKEFQPRWFSFRVDFNVSHKTSFEPSRGSFPVHWRGYFYTDWSSDYSVHEKKIFNLFRAAEPELDFSLVQFWHFFSSSFLFLIGHVTNAASEMNGDPKSIKG